MPDVHIRRTAAADLPALTRLWQTAFGDPPELIGAFYEPLSAGNVHLGGRG